MPCHPTLTAEDLRQSQDARRAAIEIFASNDISPYAWRDIQELFNRRRFQLDIIAALPPELLLHIFRSLGLNDMIRLREVSTKWRAIFTSEEVCKFMLQQFCPKMPLSMTNSKLSSEVMLRHHARRVHAHSTGHYESESRFSCKNIPYSTVYEDGDGTSFEKMVRYADGKLAWIGISPENDAFCATVQHLEEDKRFVIIPGNREELLHLTLSSSIMATISSLGICYMCDVYTGIRQDFRLPSINVVYFSSRKRKLAVILTSPDNLYSVLIHDFDSKKSFTIPLEDKIPSPNIPNVKVDVGAVLIDRSGGSFFIFSSYRCPARNKNGIYMIVTKIGFDGLCISSSSVKASSHVNSGFGYLIQPCDYQGNFVIHISSQIGCDSIRYLFNELTAQLSCVIFTRPSGEEDDDDLFTELDSQTQMHFWDGYGYFLLYTDHCILRSTFNQGNLVPYERPYRSTIEPSEIALEPPNIPMKISPIMLAELNSPIRSLMTHEMEEIETRRFSHFQNIRVPYDDDDEEFSEESSFSLMGDDRFLVAFYYNSAVVWCFDSAVKMPEGQSLQPSWI